VASGASGISKPVGSTDSTNNYSDSIRLCRLANFADQELYGRKPGVPFEDLAYEFMILTSLTDVTTYGAEMTDAQVDCFDDLQKKLKCC